MAGLGIKRKEMTQDSSSSSSSSFSKMGVAASIIPPPSKKPKTLAEKRGQLQRDILKYGVAAVEKAYYPRQPQLHAPKQAAFGVNKSKNSSPRPSPIKMKPKPFGLDFEEKDARLILKPHSLTKYIHEPQFNTVVYIARRNGIVPLSSLCKDSKSVLSANVKLIQGRNVRLGKPKVFVRSPTDDTLLAVGGTRRKENYSVEILPIPKIPSRMYSSMDSKPCLHTEDRGMKPYVIDDEYAKFAAEAVMVKRKKRMDVRKIRKQERLREEEDDEDKVKGKSIIEFLLKKYSTRQQGSTERHLPCGRIAEDEEEQEEKSIENSSPDESQSKVLTGSKEEDSSKESSASIPGIPHDGTETADEQDDLPDDGEENDIIFLVDKKINPDNAENEDPNAAGVKQEKEEEGGEEKVQIFNPWSNKEPKAPFPDIEHTAIVTPEFKARIEERRNNVLAGWDACDIEYCYCKVPDETDETPMTIPPTEMQTPVSGAQTPNSKPLNQPGNNDQTTKKKLVKVKRALKNLGVNYYEFEDKEQQEGELRSCSVDHCRFGCICDSIGGKPIAPTHCGKNECMFECICSEDAVKLASSKKIGISPAGAANLRSTVQRFMAAEERKFQNTVVATTSGRDLVMLGSSGRTKRERKVPTRYQDFNALLSDPVGKEFSGCFSDKGAADNADAEDYSTEGAMFSAEDLKLMSDRLRDETISKCIVLAPRVEIPADTSVWCMFHCQYTCPCNKFENPLDYAPDRNVRKYKPKPKCKKSPPSVEKKKKKAEEVVLVVDEDDVTERPDPEHCARTAGYVIKPSNLVKYPHTYEVKPKNRRQRVTKTTSHRPAPTLISSKVPTTTTTTPLPPAGELRTTNTTTTTTSHNSRENDDGPILSEDPELDLEIQPKNSVQYVKWSVIHREFNKRSICLYSFQKSNRHVVFIAKSTESPYVTSAVNIRNVDKVTCASLPHTVHTLFYPMMAQDDVTHTAKYAILTHNGIAWEITGVLQRKTPAHEKKKSGGEDSVPETVNATGGASSSSTNTNTTTTPQRGPKSAATTANANLNPTVVSSDTKTSKLPSGQSVISVLAAPGKTIQIKLPPTATTQHWCVVEVLSAEGSVVCPDSTLTLKCSVLKQASDLSKKENTTVRVPIPVASEVHYFGVYAVPGLPYHVFVGPFSNKAKKDAVPSEIINLDSPPNVDLATEDDDDDIQEIPNPGPGSTSHSGRKEREMNETMVGSLLESISDKAVATGEKNRRCAVRDAVTVLGQVPSVVTLDDDDDDEIMIIDEGDTDNAVQHVKKDSELLRENVAPARAPYLNLEPSNFGKTVRNAMPPKGASKRLTVPGHTEQVDVFLSPAGKVSFPHPNISKHDVLCDSEENAIKWFEENFNRKNAADQSKVTPGQRKARIIPEEINLTTHGSKQITVPGFPEPVTVFLKLGGKVVFPHPSINKHNVICDSEDSAVKWLQQHTKMYGQPDQKTDGPLNSNSRITATTEIVGENGTKGFAFFMERQARKEQTKLFQELSKVTFSEGLFHKSASRVEILNSAKEVILDLNETAQTQEQEKKSLMLERKKKFEKFSSLLGEFSPEIKKQKLLELKNVIAKKSQSSSSTVAAPAVTTIAKTDVKPPQQLPPLPKLKQAPRRQTPTQTPTTPQQVSSFPGPSTGALSQPTTPATITPVATLSNFRPKTSLPTLEALQTSHLTQPEQRLHVEQQRSQQLATGNQLSPSQGPSTSSSSSSSSSWPTPYSDMTGLKTTKKDGKVLRPMNAFMLWSKDHRKQLISSG